MAKKKNNSLKDTLNKLYENDTTLNYLKQYEKDRNKLLSSAWDNSISSGSEKLKEILSSIYMKNAFSTIENYKQYSEPILSTINNHDYDSLHELISKPINSSLNTDYKQALKATEILSDSLEKIDSLSLAKSFYYKSKLNEIINQYKIDKLKASKSILDLAYSINNDSFESKINKNIGLDLVSNALKDAYTPTVDSIKLGGTLSDAFGDINSSISKATIGLGNINFVIPKNEDLTSMTKASKSAYKPQINTTSELLAKNKIGSRLANTFTSLDKTTSSIGNIANKIPRNQGLASMSKTLESVYSPQTNITAGLLSKHKIGGTLSDTFGAINTPILQSTKCLDSIGLMNNSLGEKIKDLSSLKNTVKPIGLNNISISPPKDFKPIEIPKIQDSPIYKQNEKLIDKIEKQTEAIAEMSKYLIELGEQQEVQANFINDQNIEFLNNSNKQIELMAKILGFLSSQSEILELQKQNQELQREELNQQNNELLNNSHEQIKLMREVSNFLATQSKILKAQQENQELQNNHLKLQNEKIEEQIRELKEQKDKIDVQIDDNKKSSKIALGTAVASILIGAVVTYCVYILEDKSDSIKHKELKENLILQNKKTNLTNELLKSHFKANLKINKELLQQLKKQNLNLIQINQGLKKEDIKSIK